MIGFGLLHERTLHATRTRAHARVYIRCGLMGEGMFAHWQRLARHKIKTAKTIVRKQIYILSVCLYVVEKEWLSACSKLSAMDGVACLLLLSIMKVKQNWIKTVAVASLANGSTSFSPCVGVLMTGYTCLAFF